MPDIRVRLVGQNDLSPVLRQGEQDLSRFGVQGESLASKAASTGAKLTTGLTLPIVGIGTAAFGMASSLQDSLSLSGSVFAESAGDIDNWSDSAATSMGVAKSEAVEMANQFGIRLQNIGGVTVSESAKMSKSLTKMAADLGSAFGTSTAVAAEALNGALTGEFEMLKKFGIIINETTLKQKALEMGLTSGTGALSAQAKQQATLALITEQSTQAQGDFAKTADGAANSTKIAQAQLKDAATEIGTVFLPMATSVVQTVGNWASKFGELDGTTQSVIVGVAGVAAAAGPVLWAGGKIVESWGAVSGAFNTGKDAIKGWVTGIQDARANGDSLAGSLVGGLNPAILGATAAIGAGLWAYQAWSSNQQRVEDEARALSAALIEQGEEVLPSLTAALKNVLETRDSFDESFRRTGVTMGQVTGIINRSTGDFDQLRRSFHDSGEIVDVFRESIDGAYVGTAIAAGTVDDIKQSFSQLDPALQKVVRSLLDQVEAGRLSENEFAEWLDAAVDVDQGAMATVTNLRALATSMEETVGETNMSKEAQENLAIALGKGHPDLEARQAAVLALAAAYPEAAEAAGLVVPATEDAAGAIGGVGVQATEARDKLKDYADQVESMFSPVTNFINKSKDLKTAQDEANKALAEHGPNSQQYVDATAKVTQSAFEVSGAQSRLKTAFDNGTLSVAGMRSSLQQMVAQGVLTQQQADLMAWSIGAAKGKADEFDQTTAYATVGITGLDAVYAGLDGIATKIRAVGRPFTVGAIFGGSGGSSGGKAVGGAVYKGQSVLVGERGPEVLEIPADGYVVPNHLLSSYAAARAATSAAIGVAAVAPAQVTAAPAAGGVTVQAHFHGPVTADMRRWIVAQLEDALKAGVPTPYLDRRAATR